MKYASALKATFDSLFIPLLILIGICLVASSWSTSRRSVEHFDTASPVTVNQSALQAGGGANAINTPLSSPGNTANIVPLPSTLSTPPPGVMQTPTNTIATSTTSNIATPTPFPSLTGNLASAQAPAVTTVNPLPASTTVVSPTNPSTTAAISANSSVNPLLAITPGALGLPDPSQLSLPPVPGSTSLTGSVPAISLNNGTSSSYASSLNLPNSLTSSTNQLQTGTIPATGYATGSTTQMPAVQSASAPYSNNVAQSLLPGLTTITNPSDSSVQRYNDLNPNQTIDANKPSPTTVWDGSSTFPPALSSNMSVASAKPYADSSAYAYNMQRYAPLFDELYDVQRDLTDNVQRLRSVSGKIRSQYVPNYPMPLLEISAGY